MTRAVELRLEAEKKEHEKTFKKMHEYGKDASRLRSLLVDEQRLSQRKSDFIEKFYKDFKKEFES